MPLQQPQPVSTAGRRARGRTDLQKKLQHGEVPPGSRPYHAARSPTKAWRVKGAAHAAHAAHAGQAPMEQDHKAWDEASTEAGDSSPSRTTEAGDCSPCRMRLRAIEAEDPSSATADPAAVKPSAPPSPTLTEEALVEQGLARLLTQMSAMATPTASARRSPFECKFPPGISIHAYVARLLRLSQCSAGCVVLSLVYLDRLIKRHRWIAVSPLTCHRLVLTSIVVAIKFYDDTYFSNKFYSQVGGVSLTELNYLERQFLGLVDFKLCVEPREYELYRDILLKAVNTGMVGAAPDAAKGA